MKSECCEAEVKIMTSSPWIKNPQYPSTNWYQCQKCFQPCDIIEEIDYADKLTKTDQGEEITDQGER